MQDQFKQLLDDFVDETGASFGNATDAVALYMAERTAYLATLIGQPGYGQAVIAERDNVVLNAALNVVDAADISRDRLIGLVQGALTIGAQALVPNPEA